MKDNKAVFKKEAMRIQTKYERLDSVFSFLRPVFLTIAVSIITVWFATSMADIWLVGFSAVFFALWVLTIIVINVSLPGMFAEEMADLTLSLTMDEMSHPEKDNL